MGHNDHIDWDLDEAVENAVDEGYIEKGTKEYGVAQQVISQGMSSLSPKQKFLYDKIVVKALVNAANDIEIRQIMNSAAD